MAAALVSAGLARRGSDIRVGSAGFVSEGMPPPREVLDAMAAVGIDLSEHRSRLVRPAMVHTADLIVAMTRQHVIDVAVLDPSGWSRSFTVTELRARGAAVGPRLPGETLRQWVGRVHAGRTRASTIALPLSDDIPDPMGGRPKGYQKVRDLLAAMASDLVDLIAPA
jgi:protein-tyrosine phosphatase